MKKKKTVKIKKTKAQVMVDQKARMFERHAGDLPILVKTDGAEYKKAMMNNISLGGMSLKASFRIFESATIKVKAATADTIPEVKGKVVWCKRNRGSYNVGVEFLETEAKFGIRMLEQLYNIENYKREVKRKEGRELSGEQAALEWVRKYAGNP